MFFQHRQIPEKKEKDFPNVFFNRFIVKSPDQLPYRAGSEF